MRDEIFFIGYDLNVHHGSFVDVHLNNKMNIDVKIDKAQVEVTSSVQIRLLITKTESWKDKKYTINLAD